MSSLSPISKPFSPQGLSPKSLAYKVLSLGTIPASLLLGSVAHAQSTNVNIQFIPPPISNYDTGGLADRGAPEGREAAGTRAPCLSQTQETAASPITEAPALTVLMPTVPVSYGDETIQTPMGTTSHAYPTFFFYMPYTQQVVDAIQFTLLDAEDYSVASVDVAVPEQAGLLSVTWPKEQLPLPVAADYHWLLQVDCHNPLEPSDQFTTDLVVEGFIRRLAVPTDPAIDPTSLDTVAQLAASGVWNDALDVLIAQLSDHPQPDTISIALSQLLASVGLEGFTPYVDES